MPPMPSNPYVTSATINNGLLEITVELDQADSGSYVEVSGSATQTGGAFANFYSIGEVTKDPASPDSNPTVKASAHPLPPNKFVNNEDVTFVIRLAKVWLTVLGPDAGSFDKESSSGSTAAGDGMTWNKLRRISHLNADDDSNAADGS